MQDTPMDKRIAADPALFAELMRTLVGGVTLEEASALRRYAALAGAGCIVEIGSYQGKSAVALAMGVLDRGAQPRPMIYCVDPHREYTGFYGGRFGPEDRGRYYQTMLSTGAYRHVGLINLPSEDVASSWKEPVGMLFIDGNHHYEGVRADADNWMPHVPVGGYVAFDDAADEQCGPHRVIEELSATGRFRRLEQVGKVVFLEKIEALPEEPVYSSSGRKILVACERVANTGGLWRFDRIAASLRAKGDELCYLALDPSGNLRETDVPVLSPEEAAWRRWDCTMLPGAAFSRRSLERFDCFQDSRFGVRVQHVLNDQSRKKEFLAVNAAFKPHVVIFNNDAWPEGSYTEFQAHRFHRLIGAVDAERFAPGGERRFPLREGRFVVGGQASKNPGPLLDAVGSLPDGVVVKLFGDVGPEWVEKYAEMAAAGRLEWVGPLGPGQLETFYQSVDCVVHTELFAGWANLVAEAMASGVPVICSGHGTSALAKDRSSALVLDRVSAGEIADRVGLLMRDADLCRRLAREGRRIAERFPWEDYTDKLLALCRDDGRGHYIRDEALGLYGKWPKAWRLAGLEPLFDAAAGKTVLDLGSAEGVIAHEFQRRGASAVHGFEADSARVEFSAGLCDPSVCRFRAADFSDRDAFLAAHGESLLPDYGIVLFLGVYHHLPQFPEGDSPRRTFLEEALRRAADYFAIRTPGPDMLDAEQVINRAGFELVSGNDERKGDNLGGLRIYRRRAPIPFVSFPKSGRSWVRYILTELGLADAYHFGHDGFEFNDGSLPEHDFSVEKRLERFAQCEKVVLLRRNPYDVIVSLYHQVTGRFKDFFRYEGTLSDFIRDPYFGAAVLRDHFAMWEEIRRNRDVFVLTYEDLHADTFTAMRKLLRYCGVEVDDAALREAVEKGDFANMKRLEKSGRFPAPWLRLRNGAPKVRKGKVNGYREEMDAGDIAYLDGVFGG
ncbi:class I SAM-dependent methyltransferase [Desulfovibrio sp. Huiquan2017]|uniref:class I SAM-dependent methyltransferase n=1 Tax=Desulfovibrio sp. Huiquan2017 TaxID=2816861 RepID=UPI001A92E04F|nr:class I SAM-dependent methyltransferase [Desulfovibrio sp. Huiquan2017]